MFYQGDSIVEYFVEVAFSWKSGSLLVVDGLVSAFPSLMTTHVFREWPMKMLCQTKRRVVFRFNPRERSKDERGSSELSTGTQLGDCMSITVVGRLTKGTKLWKIVVVVIIVIMKRDLDESRVSCLRRRLLTTLLVSQPDGFAMRRIA